MAANDQDQLRKKREDAIEQISDAFGSDHLALAEFERRLALAHQATDDSSLSAVVQDLPARVIAAAPVVANVPARAPAERRVMRAVLGSVERRGAWNAPPAMEARAVFGSIVLDFREASLEPGVTEVHVKARFGSIEIIVPPTLAVTVDGSAVLGSFDHLERAPSAAEPNTPVLRIVGTAVLGSVEVITRLPKGRNPKGLEP